MGERPPFVELPDQDADPVVWDPMQRRFVPSAAHPRGPAAEPSPASSPALPASAAPAAATPVADRDGRRFYVGAEAMGQAPPPMLGGRVAVAERPRVSDPVPAPTPAPTPGPPQPMPPLPEPQPLPPQPMPPQPEPPPLPPQPMPPQPEPPLPSATRPAPLPLPRPRSRTAEEPQPATAPKHRRRFPLPHLRRPKLRWKLWLILLPTLLPILLLGGLLLYVNTKYNEIEKIPVGHLMDSGGSGENILIVGSDTRANADPNAANADVVIGDETNPAPTGQRADTMMVMRLQDGAARILSVPRDLIVTVSGTGQRTRVNTAFNTELGGGPERLITTIRDNLAIPIHRYMEVDFVTFAGLVDAVGGVTIVFPNPAFDPETGLDVQQSGPVELNGDQALAYVRSRHYTEVINGRNVEDPTADLGRVRRQQVFLQAVMGKVAGSKNPITLLRIGGEVADGLRVDDGLGLWDAIQLAWGLRGVNPEPVELPVTLNRDFATLSLAPDADATLATFRG